ncbi:MAG: MgtC/SapB family protein [Myxococcales bacterium]|nr:MAG: MgtC/SapB family protein [Myxococcales bacterium]
MHFAEVFETSFWIRLALATFCGAAIGLERQVKGKPAGVRTSALICLGSATFVRMGSYLEGPSGDPARLLGQVIVGVGFLGGGVILSRGETVHGMTSAAVIWILAAIGAAAGLDLYGVAIAITLVTGAILAVMSILERLFSVLRRGVHAVTPQKHDLPVASHTSSDRMDTIED